VLKTTVVINVQEGMTGDDAADIVEEALEMACDDTRDCIKYSRDDEERQSWENKLERLCSIAVNRD
jgi:hypothetical protein